MRKVNRAGVFAAAFLWVCTAGMQGHSVQAARPKAPDPLTSPDSRVDINFATMDDMLKVPGMTRTWAARIIRFRPYRTKGDLVERGVITNQVYSRIKDYVIAHREKH